MKKTIIGVLVVLLLIQSYIIFRQLQTSRIERVVQEEKTEAPTQIETETDKPATLPKETPVTSKEASLASYTYPFNYNNKNVEIAFEHTDNTMITVNVNDYSRVQFFIVDKAEPNTVAKNIGTLYIEISENRCYLNYCTLPVLETFSGKNLEWSHRGSSTYRDVDAIKTTKNVYSATKEGYTIYFEPFEAINSVNVKPIFDSFNLTVK